MMVRHQTHCAAPSSEPCRSDTRILLEGDMKDYESCSAEVFFGDDGPAPDTLRGTIFRAMSLRFTHIARGRYESCSGEVLLAMMVRRQTFARRLFASHVAQDHTRRSLRSSAMGKKVVTPKFFFQQWSQIATTSCAVTWV